MARLAGMEKLFLNGEPLSITMTQSHQVIYSSMPEVDPDWTYRDLRGHKHYYDNGYPTLEWVAVGTYFCYECNENHENSEHRCIQCGEEIKPGTRPPSPFGTVLPGLIEVTAEVVGEQAPQEFEFSVGEERFKFIRVSRDISSHEVPRSSYVGQPIDS